MKDMDYKAPGPMDYNVAKRNATQMLNALRAFQHLESILSAAASAQSDITQMEANRAKLRKEVVDIAEAKEKESRRFKDKVALLKKQGDDTEAEIGARVKRARESADEQIAKINTAVESAKADLANMRVEHEAEVKEMEEQLLRLGNDVNKAESAKRRALNALEKLQGT